MSKTKNILTASDLQTETAIPLEAEVMLRPLLYKIHNEDCRTTLAKLPAECIDLVVTSPPYDELRTYKGHEWNFEIFKEIAEGLSRVLKQGGVIVWVVNDATRNGSETLTSFLQALYFKNDCGLNAHDTMLYLKNAPLPANKQHKRYAQQFEYCFVFSKGQPKTFNPIMEKCLHAGELNKTKYRQQNGELEKRESVILDEKIRGNAVFYNSQCATKDSDAFNHPAIFPEALAEDNIKTWSNENDIVYDPFSGSGTTCKVADRLGRIWLGSEIAEEYQSVALRRIENDLFTKAST